MSCSLAATNVTRRRVRRSEESPEEVSGVVTTSHIAMATEEDEIITLAVEIDLERVSLNALRLPKRNLEYVNFWALWAERKARLGGMILKLQLMFEQKRLAETAAAFEEEHGRVHKEDCALCLEAVLVDGTIPRFP